MKKTLTQNLSKYFFTFMATTAFTILWVQAWQWLTAENWDTLDYNKWNQLVNTVQSGRIPWEVVAFNLSSCPTGWTEYTTARWRTIIGVWNGVGLTSRSIGETWWWEGAPILNGTLQSILYATSKGPWSSAPSSNATICNTGTGGPSGAMYLATTGPATDLVPLNEASVATSFIPNSGASADNMQPYVALLYCVKN